MEYINLIKIGELLRKKRKELGFRMEDLADDQISPSTISNIERGISNVNLEKISYFANKLGINLEQIPDLITEENNKEKKLESHLIAIENIIDLVSPEKGLEFIKKLNVQNNHSNTAMASFLKGKCYYQKKNWSKAQTHFHEAIRLVDQVPELKKSNIKAACYNELGRTAYFRNDLIQALSYTEAGIEEFSEDGDRQYCGYILIASKAIYLEKLERLEEALRTIDQLWQKINHIESVETVLNLYEIRAKILKKAKIYTEAIKYTKKGIEIARINNIYDRAFDLWTTLGSIYFQIREFDEAENCFLTALCLKEKIKKEYLYISTYTQLGLLYLEQKNWGKAHQTLEEAVKIGEQLNDVLRNIQALIALGDCYLKQALYSEAIHPYQKALEWAQRHILKIQEREILLKLAQCWDKIDRRNFQECVENLFRVEVELTQDESNKMRVR